MLLSIHVAADGLALWRIAVMVDPENTKQRYVLPSGPFGSPKDSS